MKFIAWLIPILVLSVGCQSEKAAFEVMCQIEEHCPQFASNDLKEQRLGWRCLYEEASGAGQFFDLLEKSPPKARHDRIKQRADELGIAECPGAGVLGSTYDDSDVAKEICNSDVCPTETSAGFYTCITQKFPKSGLATSDAIDEATARSELRDFMLRSERAAILLGEPLPETCANVLLWEPEPTFAATQLASNEPVIDTRYTCDGKGEIPGPFIGNLPKFVHCAVVMTSDETSPERVHYLNADNRYRGPDKKDALVGSYVPPCPAKGKTNAYSLKFVLYHGDEVPDPKSWEDLEQQIDGRVMKTYEKKLSYTRAK